MSKYGKRTGAPAKDKRGDMPLPKSAPQVRAANQNGHPVLKNTQAEHAARADYFGGLHSSAATVKLYKPYRGMNDDAANAGGDKRPPVYHKPLSASFGDKRDWTRVSMGNDKDADDAMNGTKGAHRTTGIVVGQRIKGTVCPQCNLALPLTRICTECS
jgi:hypothetical protein